MRAAVAVSLAALPVACSAQIYTYSGPAAPTPTPFAPVSDQDLDQLTAPIALYPDPLLAQLLPAATYPIDVVAAEQWSRANPTATDSMIDAQPWDPSVKALLHYPTVIEMMTNDIAWTQRLGEAYVNQQADVMNSIQRLRAQAQTAGSLVNTPQQQVVVDDGDISIIPAEPEVIYVPEYDPTIVYYHPYPLRFGNGFHFGIWLDKDTDWHRHWINEGVHWDRQHWDQRDHPPDRRVVVVDHRPAEHPEVHQWQRNPEKPVVVHLDHPQHDDPHGYVPPHAEPAPAPQHAFGDVKPRQEVEHEEDRGRASLHQPAPVRAAPPPHVAPAAPPPHVDSPHAPPPRVDSPQPHAPPPPARSAPPPPPAHNDSGHGGGPAHH